jgi:hypothetical protein
MKIKNLILGLTVLLAVSSCSDDENYTIILKESGRLTLNVTNEESPIVGQNVYLIPQMNDFDKASGPSPGTIEYSIDNQETDENGKVSFGDVNVGNYYLVMEDVEIDGKFYNPSKLVQAVSDVNKLYSLNVMDYTGTIEVTVKNYSDITYEYELYSGAKVAILTDDDYYSSSDVEERLSKKIEQQTTSTSGKVVFDLPSGVYYHAIVYITNTEGDIESYSNSLTYLSPSEEYTTSFNTNF